MKRGLNVAMYAVSGIAIALALSFATVAVAGHGLNDPAAPLKPVLAATPSPTATRPPRSPSPKPSARPSPPSTTQTPPPTQAPVTTAPVTGIFGVLPADIATLRSGLIIETGRVSMSGTTEALSDNPAIRQAYLGI